MFAWLLSYLSVSCHLSWRVKRWSVFIPIGKIIFKRLLTQIQDENPQFRGRGLQSWGSFRGIIRRKNLTQQIGVAVTLLPRIREVLCSNLNQDGGYPDRGFRWFSQYLPANSGISLLPHPFQFVSRPDIRRNIVSIFRASLNNQLRKLTTEIRLSPRGGGL